MFDIELIRKMFIYEKVNKKQFDMKDFKQLLKIDSNLIDQKRFKEWVDNNSSLEELNNWLKRYSLEKTFLEVYVVGKTSTEEFVDFLYDYGQKLPETTRKEMLSDFLDKERKKNKEMFE